MKVKIKIDGGVVLRLPVYVEFDHRRHEVGTVEVTLDESQVEVATPGPGIDF